MIETGFVEEDEGFDGRIRYWHRVGRWHRVGDNWEYIHWLNDLHRHGEGCTNNFQASANCSDVIVPKQFMDIMDDLFLSSILAAVASRNGNQVADITRFRNICNLSDVGDLADVCNLTNIGYLTDVRYLAQVEQLADVGDLPDVCDLPDIG